MVDNNDTKFQEKSPEQQRKGLDGTEPVGSRFNMDAKLGAEIANASPEAQQAINQMYKVEESRLVSEASKQERSREFRVLKEKDRLMEKYFSEPAPIPNDPEAKKLVYQTIQDQAQRTVQERELYFTNQIKNSTDQNVREVIKMDQQGILPAQKLGQEHNDEHEHSGR